jgi:D-glycero-alpha-D-manno-heptose-7-phosphate kinase
MSLQSRAPTRIDLAGGTLDIWPVYLLLERAATVNVAIDLYAEASIELAQERWRVRDEDTGREAEASSAAELAGRPGAEIAGSLLQFFAPSEPCAVTTRSLAPPRSGLGASSALGIAIASALNALTGARYTSSRLIEIVKDIEAQVLGAMTGVQDHYPGVYGGASCLWWGIGGTRREPLPLDAGAFEERFLLAYTNQPHRSGVNNWEVIKRFLDGDSGTRRAFEEIGRVAVSMRDALADENLDQVARLIGEEWEARRRLAPAVSSPEIERILEAALAAGGEAGKACGAGGGGCLLIATKAGKREQAEDAIRGAGGSLLAFHVDARGLQLDPSSEIS